MKNLGNGNFVNDVDLQNCRYIGDGQDCEGTFYDIQENDIRNIMANAENGDFWETGCQRTFSTGQGIRMREALSEDKRHMFYKARTSINSL